FSHSDTEVILRCFQQYGSKTWEMLNGMFALALYDSAEDVLFLARDHAGIKPLYVYQDSKNVVFASEIKAIFRSGLVEPQVDEESIASYLRLGYFPRAKTPYQHITKLLPGEFMRIYSSGVERKIYWNIRSFPMQKRMNRSGVSELDELLNASVQRQMISDVPI